MKTVVAAALSLSLLCFGLVAYAGNSSKSSSEIGTAVLLPPIPGERYRAVTPVTVPETVCTRGWTATIRPPVGYTSALKKWLLKDRMLPGTVSDYQLDHLISLELGGAPYSTRNLWMEPQAQAHRDDAFENEWHRELCAGHMTLQQARHAEISYKKANG